MELHSQCGSVYHPHPISASASFGQPTTQLNPPTEINGYKRTTLPHFISPHAELNTLYPPAIGQPICPEQIHPAAGQTTHYSANTPTWPHPIGPRAYRWQQPLGGKLKTLCQEGRLGPALDALNVAIDQQVSLSAIEIACQSLLSTCEKRKSLHQAQQVHVHLASYGLDIASSLGEHLVSTYFKCGGFHHALYMFHILPHRTAISWTAIISAHLDSGESHLALEIYKLMQEEGVAARKFTFLRLLKACSNNLDLAHGRTLHVDAQRMGLDSDPYIGSALMNMYGKCGDLVAAVDVFRGMHARDIVSWSAILSSYLEQGQSEVVLLLYRQMHDEGLKPDLRLIMIALQACCILAEKEEAVFLEGHSVKVKSWEIGKALHADALKVGVLLDLFVRSTLVSMYSKCGDIAGARIVFDTLSRRDVVLWTVMLSAYIEQGEGEVTLRLFRQMLQEGIRPDDKSFMISLQACALLTDLESGTQGHFTKLKCLEIGQALHMDAQRMGFCSGVFLGSTLVNMNSKCGNIKEAEKVFHELPFRDIILWNAMLSAYVEQGEAEKALHLFKDMQEEGAGFDECTFVVTLQACCMFVDEEEVGLKMEASRKVTSFEIGEAIHVDILMEGIDLSSSVGSTLLSMYSRCGSVVEAEQVFNRMPSRNVVSWNAMLSAYLEHGQGEKALQLYQHMRETRVSMDDVTVVCVLQACSETGNTEICKEIHFIITSNISDLSLLLATTLVHAYGSCSSMADSLAIFCKVPQHDVVSWNAFISGHARGGDCTETLEVFEKMLQLGVKPNGLTFLPVLSVCSHAGLLDKGVAYFESMTRDYGITPKIAHYASMLDLLVRAGDLLKVVNLFSRMPVEPDIAMWICLLGACQKYQNVELGKYAFDHAVRLQPKEPASYILMSNIYVDANMHEFAIQVENARRREGACTTMPRNRV